MIILVLFVTVELKKNRVQFPSPPILNYLQNNDLTPCQYNNVSTVLAIKQTRKMRATEPYTIFQRTLLSGKKVYYFQYRDSNGHRSVPKSTGCTTLSSARRYCQQLYNNNLFTTSNNSITFKSFSNDFFSENSEFRQWKKANGRDLKPETVARYTSSLNKHILPYFADIKLKDITTDICKKWIIWASSQWTPHAVNNDQGVLNIILESAVDKELINKNPLRKLGMRKTEKKHRELLTIDELSALYSTSWPQEIEKKAFLLASITGMRIGEVIALQKTDISNNVINVTKDISDKFGLQNSNKTNLKRKVPIPTNFLFPESNSIWVFDCNGSPIKAHSIYNAFTRRCDKLLIDRKARGIDIHSLRDFFVTYLRNNGIQDAKIRAIVGHADKTMTDVYTHWDISMFSDVCKIQQELYNLITRS